MGTDFAGRVALVTGAGRNIGRATALAFAQQGANLVLCTRRSMEQLEETAHEAASCGVRVITEQCDIGQEAEVQTVVEHALREFGRVDILVNNATSRIQGGFLDITPEQWTRNVAVNLDGPYFACRWVLPSMVEQQWGRIINYSGISAYHGGNAAKAAVKLGIVGFTRSLAREFGRSNITVNAIAPSAIKGERDPGMEREADLRGEVDKQQAIRRFGTPEEVAALVTFLASDQAGYITGQCIPINGGGYFA
ncbi:MAG: SDR family NAD(P)-dependent oxidoreductase [Dehalococcoidia bacterium]